MTGKARTAEDNVGRSPLRGGPIALAVIQAATGLWLLLPPRSFYDNVLGVSALPPYNQHLLTDLGGFYLGLAFVLAAATFRLRRSLVRTALGAFLLVVVAAALWVMAGGLPADSAAGQREGPGAGAQ